MQFSIDDFTKVRVLVVGDVMLDRYLWGSVERISPEAPVPVVNLTKKSTVAGGAANVAANISGLRAKPILIGVVGDDFESVGGFEVLEKDSISSEHLVKLKRPTTIKTRVVAHNQQIVRIDQENSNILDSFEENLLWEQIENVFEEIDLVLISDYAKGVITESLATRLITLARANDKFIIVDPKGQNYKKYKHSTILTPNLKEALDAAALETIEERSIEEVGQKLLKEIELEALIITRGERGMSLFQEGSETRDLRSLARKVYDVTGAGDTVIATLAVAIGSGIDFYNSAKIANIAAGLVVEKVGTTTINIDLLRSEISNQKKLPEEI